LRRPPPHYLKRIDWKERIALEGGKAVLLYETGHLAYFVFRLVLYPAKGFGRRLVASELEKTTKEDGNILKLDSMSFLNCRYDLMAQVGIGAAKIK
jgi:hypothetical protein